MPTTSKGKDILAGDLVSQTTAGIGATIRLVTYVDNSATPVRTIHFIDGTSITMEDGDVGDVAIFVVHGTIL